jgi:hypothetical protein
MNRWLVRVAWLAAALLLSGCAKLSVTVDVLDRERIPPEKRLESNVWLEAQRYASEVESGFYERLERTLVAELDGVADMLFERKVIAAANDPEVRRDIADGIRSFGTRRTKAARQKSDEGLRLYESVRDPSAPDRTTTLTQALLALQDGRAQLRDIGSVVERDLTEMLARNPGVDPQGLEKARDAITAALEDTRRLAQARHPLFGGFTLFEDPLASWVVNSDEEAWRGGFNESYGAGYLGNVDVAIKMEADGVFTLKGVRLDASKTTEATFAVIRQSLNVVAAGVGVPGLKAAPPKPAPAADPSSSTSPADTPDVSERLVASAETIRASERHQREQAQYAMSAIFDVIARNAKAITTSPDDAREQAIQQIKVVYGAYKPLIEAPQSEGDGK